MAKRNMLVFSGFEKGVTEIRIDFGVKPAVVLRPNGMRAVEYGSIVFALPVESKWTRNEFTRDGVERKFPYCDYVIERDSEWQYALCDIDAAVEENGVGDIPFYEKRPPLTLKARVCSINWGYQEGYSTVARKLPNSKKPTGETVERVLIPYGCTIDRDHLAPTIAAIDKGYDILLEKPIAPTPEECVRITKHANKKGVNVLVCHDLDILQWLVDKPCRRIHSFGSLTYFTEKNKPEGVPLRCIDGCPHADICYYNAVKIYLEDVENDWFRTSATHQVAPTDADVEKALRETDYGKCVFQCNNDVVDHQIVNMEFEDGITVNVTMEAFNAGGRSTVIMGTKGEIRANMKEDHITVYDFSTRAFREIKLADAMTNESITGGHGGGDIGIVYAFYDLLTGNTESKSICDISVACNNHMLSFAAEE